MTTAELMESTGGTREDSVESERFAQGPILDEREAAELRARWQQIQAGFVDDPQNSVGQADQLIATAIQRLTEIFAGEKATLERTWSGGQKMSTEDMRQSLRRYRSFFDRILSV